MIAYVLVAICAGSGGFIIGVLMALGARQDASQAAMDQSYQDGYCAGRADIERRQAVLVKLEPRPGCRPGESLN